MVDESENENGDEEACEGEVEIETEIGDAEEVVDGGDVADEPEPVVELPEDAWI